MENNEPKRHEYYFDVSCIRTDKVGMLKNIKKGLII